MNTFITGLRSSANRSATFALIAPITLAIATAEGAPPAEPLNLEPATKQRCLDILEQAVRSDEFWPSMHAAEALTLAGKGELVRELLAPRLPKETDDQQRCGLARELVRAGDRTAAKVMLDILAGDDPYGHVHAAESLYKVNEIGDGAALRRAQKQSQNSKLQLMAAAALARRGSRQSFALLRRSLDDDDPEVGKIAAWILARIGDKRDIPPLRRGAEKFDDRLRRAYFYHALAALGDPQGRRALRQNLSDEDPAIRTYAATFAGDAYDLEAAGALTKLLDDPHLDARIRAAQSLLVLSQARVSKR